MPKHYGGPPKGKKKKAGEEEKTEELLDDKVRAALEQVGREAVAEGAGRDVLFDAGCVGSVLHDALNRPRGQVAVETVTGK